jgi:hypothetical protein
MHDAASTIKDNPSRVCITKIGPLFPKSNPSPSPYILSTENWKSYSNSNWNIYFKYPPDWKIVESSQLIKVYPSGYLKGTFFTITQIKENFSKILDRESDKLSCKLEDSPIGQDFGEDKNIIVESAFNHCNKIIGFYYLYGKTGNILIQHSFSDSGVGNSVGAVLSTFKFTN